MRFYLLYKYDIRMKTLGLFIFLMATQLLHATNLGVGDLAITSANADSPDNFSFVLLTNISGTTTVYFTERGWDNDANGGGAAPNWAATGDGTITWTYVGSLTAGTEIQITNPQSGGTATIAGTATAAGTTSESASFSVSSSSDVIIAYTGTGVPNNGSEVTNFIWATAWNDPFIDNASASTSSSLPTGLTVGTNAVEFAANSGDNIQYDCSTTMPVATLRTALANNSNYNLSNVTTYAAPACTYLVIVSTTWNGTTWSNGTPNASTNAIIAGNVAPGNFTCKDLTINNGFALVFGSNHTVTVTGTSVNNNGFGIIAADGTAVISFDNDGNTITLLGNQHSFRGTVNVEGTTTLATAGKLNFTAPSATSFGQLTGTGSISGDITAQAFLDANPGRYFYLGSPFTDVELIDFNEPNNSAMVSSNNAQGTAWEWDAANAEWDPAGNTNLFSTATRGRGYAMFVGTNVVGSTTYGPFLIDDNDGTGTISVTGITNNSATVSSPLSYNNGQSATVGFVTGSGTSDTEGWNLVANPYLAIYDWDGQAIPADMSSAVYRYNGTNYSAYVKGAGTASRYIAPFQAFFVQLTDNTPGNLVFSRGNRSANSTATLAKTSSYTIDGVDVSITNNTGAHDGLFVGFESQSTTGFDVEWDARKLRNADGVPNFYTAVNGQEYAVCRVPLSGPKSFPLMLAHTVANDSLEITLDKSRLSSFAKVELEDLKMGVRHDFAKGSYAFTNDTAFGVNRFVLHFSENTVGLEEQTNAPRFEPYVYNSEKQVYLELGNLERSTVQVFNMAGQILYTQKNAAGLQKLPIAGNGVFVVKVQTQNHQQTIKFIK